MIWRCLGLFAPDRVLLDYPRHVESSGFIRAVARRPHGGDESRKWRQLRIAVILTTSCQASITQELLG